MNRLIETIRNIFKIEELRKRILYTILIILVYRFGSFVVIPGVDPNQLSILQRSSEGGLLGLLNMFSGGAFGTCLTSPHPSSSNCSAWQCLTSSACKRKVRAVVRS